MIQDALPVRPLLAVWADNPVLRGASFHTRNCRPRRRYSSLALADCRELMVQAAELVIQESRQLAKQSIVARVDAARCKTRAVRVGVVVV